MTLLDLLDLSGTFFFALSGAMMAIRKKMDLLGIIVLGTVTAIGGGTLREILLGRFPPFVFQQDQYLYTALCASLAAFIFVEQLTRINSIVLLADALGLGTFVTIGISQALEADVTPTGAVILGAITAVAGGIMRDLLAQEIPYVLTRDFYAITCICGGVIFILLEKQGLPRRLTMSIVTAVVVLLRLLAIRYNWRLPRPR
ncbi:MAG: trimeric intracellular cation channel family protein [Dethiobacteraceae bacterium]|jgi:uncharacterized membrane protein YeiH|nr:trimeric intracellular cation channel family protein [Bacillota bacterium]